MDSLLIKQIGNLLKQPIPNISIVPDEKDIHKLYFTFYYKRDNPDNIYPRLFFDPDVDVEDNPITDSITYYGEIDLEDYPNKSPQTLLYGNIPHCHVYCMKGVLHKICFSLDRSYEWYFASHTTSLFNPSMSLLYYILNIYRFIGEDDRAHNVSIERIKNSYAYWTEYKSEITIDPPDIMIDFSEAIEIHSSIIHPNSENNHLESLKNDYSDDLFKIVSGYTDYVDKKYIVLDFKPTVLPISYNISGSRRSLKLSSLDLISYKYFELGIRKTSFGKSFTNCFPIVINSKFWDLKTFTEIIKVEMSKVFITSTPAIFNGEEFDEIDTLIYYVLMVLDGTFHHLMKGKGITDTSIKGIIFIHHAFIYLIEKLEWFKERMEYLLDNDHLEVNNNLMSTIGIVFVEKKVNWKKYMVNMFNRIIKKAISDHTKIKHVIYLDANNKFCTSDACKLMDIIWINGHRNFQRIVFQKVYNELFAELDLNTMDNFFGGIDSDKRDEIKSILENIFNMKVLKGFDGINKSLQLLNIDMTPEELLNDGLVHASENMNTENLVIKWTNEDQNLSTYYNPYQSGCNKI